METTETTELTNSIEILKKFERINNFEEMGLKISLLKGIYGYGFEKPSIIQQDAISPMIHGRDLIAQAQSGTGKTGTFTIGALQLVDEELNSEQVIVLSPTRELARQTYKVFQRIGENMNITIKEVIGGQFQGRYQGGDKGGGTEQKKPQVIVGTPGKILDDLSHGRINNADIKLLVMDEADEMLSKGFSEQIRNIFTYLSKTAQMALFSATISPEVLEITEKFMNHPYKILVKNEELTLEGIRQYYVDVGKESYKYDSLCDLYGTISITQCIIYCNTKKKVESLSAKLRENNFTVSCFYGDMLQTDRTKIMESFRCGETRILITTDVLARGIDVQQVSLVINYDLPNEVETYIHRVGRTGRHGKKGVCISFCTGYDIDQVRYLEKFYRTQIMELPANVASILV